MVPEPYTKMTSVLYKGDSSTYVTTEYSAGIDAIQQATGIVIYDIDWRVSGYDNPHLYSRESNEKYDFSYYLITVDGTSYWFMTSSFLSAMYDICDELELDPAQWIPCYALSHSGEKVSTSMGYTDYYPVTDYSSLPNDMSRSRSEIMQRNDYTESVLDTLMDGY